MNDVRLRVEGLTVTYPGPPPVRALGGVAMQLTAGSCLCVLGESGSGKSTLARAVVGLISGATVAGEIIFDGRQLAAPEDWDELRWRQIAIVLSSNTALNPVLRIGDQVAEPIQVHLGAGRRAATSRAAELLEMVGLGGWAAERFAHQLSTGQRRLAMIAIALACDAHTIVLDEPTSGLDPATRASLLTLLANLRDQGRSFLMLTHDVPAAQRLADEVVILYRGWVAERGPAAAVLDNPRHPYAFGLINANPALGSVKDLRGIRGDPPEPGEVATGCPFFGRCTQAVAECPDHLPLEVPPSGESDGRVVACLRRGLVEVLELRSVTKAYRVGSGLHRQQLAALGGVDLTIRESEVVGLVGPNGAGKSTLSQIAANLLDPDSGERRLEGRDLAGLDAEARKAARARVQMLHPDPLEAVSSRMSVAEVIREPLEVQHVGDRAWREAEVVRLLGLVRLPAAAIMGRRAHELSTGQLQRVALARALALEPKLLVADEPVECLDPSERAKVLQLLKALQVERGMAMLFVSHDLSVVLRVADRVVVMDGGVIVEEASGTDLLQSPAHPVTRRLLEASGADLQSAVAASDTAGVL